MKRQRAEQRGRDAERQAAEWLRGQGWDILAERRKTKVGEIDVVARRGGVVAFVEVKWRAKASELDFAIDEARLSRVAAAADSVAHEYAVAGEDIRIDVLLIAPGMKPRLIENAWMP